MIEVFKTTVSDKEQSQDIISELMKHFPSGRINFDLEDCDNVLRIDADKICPLFILDFFYKKGLKAEQLLG